MKATLAANPNIRPVDSAFMWRVFVVFGVMALLSVAISLGGKWLGRTIVLAGHTDDTTTHEIVIGGDVVAAPANMIRFERDRRDGVAERLDLYARWPDMAGYSTSASADFNNVDGSRRILFLSFEERMMSRDMSGRFEPIYRRLVEPAGKRGPSGITFHDFTEKSGYMNEVLAVAPRAGSEPFVARCLTGPTASESLAPCERDIQVGQGLSLTYRFPIELLAHWQALDRSITDLSRRLVRTGH